MCQEELDIVVGLLGSPDERYQTVMVSRLGVHEVLLLNGLVLGTLRELSGT